MVRPVLSRQETMKRRIQTILENRDDVNYWSNLYEHQDNLVFIIRSQLIGTTRSQAIDDEFIIRQVGLWLQFNTNVSSISSLGNVADDDSDQESSIEKTKSFNAPGWERLPESPPTPVIHRERHRPLQPPSETTEADTEYPNTDASGEGSRTDESVHFQPNAPTIVIPAAEAMEAIPPSLESTRIEFQLLMIPVPTLYGNVDIGMTLEEEAEFNDMADNQPSNGSEELANYNSYIQLEE